MADQKLTTRQRQIYEFIQRHTQEKGYPPTVRDIGKAIGLTSSSTVHAHLANLERLGMLRRDPTKPRAMEVLADKAKRAVVPSGLPLVGRVAAGTPILAEENIEEYVEVSPLAGGDGGDYVLEVRGDSMKDAGILDGDTVVVRKQATASDGDIVVAVVGAEEEPEVEATVKRYFRERDHIRLEPENEDFEPIRSPDVTVAGRVIGVFRRCT
ncbi:MAG: repressor LexA [Thermoleophilaceae bacterium]|nr:repressor LexA [Thermoleophilaceae bacterium]